MRAPHAVRVVYLVGQLDFEVTVGGVIQWLTNRSGRCAAETASALEEIGATKCAELVNMVLMAFPGARPPEEDAERVGETIAVAFA
jgi:Domain of unknown function (DUF4375)